MSQYIPKPMAITPEVGAINLKTFNQMVKLWTVPLSVVPSIPTTIILEPRKKYGRQSNQKNSDKYQYWREYSVNLLQKDLKLSSA